MKHAAKVRLPACTQQRIPRASNTFCVNASAWGFSLLLSARGSALLFPRVRGADVRCARS
eukprot:3289769-Rhodomonas_salina.1